MATQDDRTQQRKRAHRGEKSNQSQQGTRKHARNGMCRETSWQADTAEFAFPSKCLLEAAPLGRMGDETSIRPAANGRGASARSLPVLPPA
jgi:hypothetical protein